MQGQQILNIGRHVFGHLSSADAQVAAAITLYDVENDNAAYALLSTEFLCIESYTIVANIGAQTVTLFFDNDADGNVDAGEVLFQGKLDANVVLPILGGFNAPFFYPHGKKGIGLKVKTSGAGQIDVTINGYVRARITQPASVGTPGRVG